jgi:hypothetical protein
MFAKLQIQILRGYGITKPFFGTGSKGISLLSLIYAKKTGSKLFPCYNEIYFCILVV